jgi:hypothetical protein
LASSNLVAREREWLVSHSFSDSARTDALGANADRLDLTAWQRSLDRLKIGKKSSTGNPSDLRSHSTQILGLTSGLDHIANLGRLTANFTSS